jgi:heme-degrading monooxygenase HmoA
LTQSLPGSIVSLTIIRYPRRYVFFALCAMAIHRFPLWRNRQIPFWKLMGCGKNGTFDINPDWRQWAIMAAHKNTIESSNIPALLQELYGSFITRWFRFFKCETWTVLLESMEGHGTWNGKQPFGDLLRKTETEVAVLTRATIRLSRLKQFWKHVDQAATAMVSADGFITSFGIGEMPFIRQATFSIWQSREQMKKFAYSLPAHAEIVKKTRKERWYSEDMFVRFRILKTIGTVNGKNPTEGYGNIPNM